MKYAPKPLISGSGAFAFLFIGFFIRGGENSV